MTTERSNKKHPATAGATRLFTGIFDQTPLPVEKAVNPQKDKL